MSRFHFNMFKSCYLKRKRNQRDRPRDVPRDVASVFQTHYLIIGTTYQSDNVRERDRQQDHFQNCYIFVARRAGCRASHVALDIALVVALVCGQSLDCRVCRRAPRRVPNRVRAHVHLVCFALVIIKNEKNPNIIGTGG